MTDLTPEQRERLEKVTDGQRRNQWGGIDSGSANRKADGSRDKKSRPSHYQRSKRQMDGSTESQQYEPPVLANPGNVISGTIGGGQMGDPIAHENEAPFPEWLAEFFIRTFCPEAGIVLDPFSGSGTTVAVARRWGRRAIGIELREKQNWWAAKRIEQQLLFPADSPAAGED